MKRTIFIVTMFIFLTIFACTGNNAKELFDTAKLEEIQNNKEHAQKLYEEIIKKYPDSEYAKNAQERLRGLNAKK
ncbi:MAG: tetratricopeptide repeat protein [Desulfobacterales bacterium]|nr:tetratricopeptide repeat protein [Desulfobacterales bacterium]MBF0398804.1 tetratricopeptide repeat protein [Desulfobacterales bacterium]